MFKYIAFMVTFSLFFVVSNCWHVSVGQAAECTEQFSWLPNAETDIDGYKLYYGTSNGGPYSNVVNIENPTVDADGRVYGDITGLTCGTTYYVVCVAYNTQAVESSHSSQVTFTPPDPNGSTAITKIFGDVDGTDYSGTIADTFININENNAVSSTTLKAYTWPENQVANSILLRINLSQIPANAQIQSATLELYQTDAGGDAAYNLTIHKILNHNPDLSQTTGFVFAGSSQWTANTQCYNNIPMAQADIATTEDTVSADQISGYTSWNVTQMVSDWIGNPSANYGLLVNADATASADSYRTFAASEAADAGQRPRLTIVYSIAADGLQPPDGFSLQLN